MDVFGEKLDFSDGGRDRSRKPAPPAAIVHGERLAPALAPRDWVLDTAARRGRAHFFLIGSGTAEVQVGPGRLALAAPACVWLPPGAAHLVRLQAGATGHMVAADEDFVARVVGASSEAPHLREVADRLIHVPADRLGPRLGDLAHACTMIEAEIREPERGAFAMLSVQFGALMILVWRLAGQAVETPGLRGTGSQIVQRFQHLVELHFREHWPVSRYARMLGVTEDRLHAACTRGAGRGPLGLIHGRLIEEASVRLGQTGLAIEQIGFNLGFRDPAYFSRFFKQRTGLSPMAWRRAAQEARKVETFAAWP